MKTQGQDGRLQTKSEAKNRPFCQHSASTLVLGFCLPELGGDEFLLLKPPSLWYFGTAALADEYTPHFPFEETESYKLMTNLT